MIAASMLGIKASIRVHMHDALGAAGDRALHRRAERAIASGEDAQEHRQGNARHAFDVVVGEEARDHIAGRRAEDVGEHRHAVAGVELLEEISRAQHEVIGIVLPPDREGRHLLRPAAQDLVRARQHRRADLAVRDEEHADHFSLASSALMNMPATSNLVWSWISRMQVGLVTFTSVSQSPMMSSPTSSSPRLASTGPSACAISCCRADRGFATALAPAARLPRDSPAFGMRARQCGTGLPSMSSTRWSPALISGM